MPLWHLRGATGKVLSCSLQQTSSYGYVLVVAMGSETLLYETYPDEASATGRAVQIRDALLANGRWAAASEVEDPDSGRCLGRR